MAVTNVTGPSRGDHAFGRARLGADNQVILIQAKLLQRQREKRKELWVEAGGKGKSLQERSGDLVRTERILKRGTINHQGKNIGLRKHLRQGLEHPLAASPAHQPVVHQGHAQSTQFFQAFCSPFTNPPGGDRCGHAIADTGATEPVSFSAETIE